MSENESPEGQNVVSIATTQQGTPRKRPERDVSMSECIDRLEQVDLDQRGIPKGTLRSEMQQGAARILMGGLVLQAMDEKGLTTKLLARKTPPHLTEAVLDDIINGRAKAPNDLATLMAIAQAMDARLVLSLETDEPYGVTIGNVTPFKPRE